MAERDMNLTLHNASAELRAALDAALQGLPGLTVTGAPANKGAAVLLLELGSDPEQDFQFLAESHHQYGRCLVAGPADDPAAILRAMRLGVAEYLPRPVAAQELAAVLGRFLAEQTTGRGGEDRGRGRVITVAGAKGGIGATTLAVNLAAAMLANGGSAGVALLDLREPLGEIPLFLDLDYQYTWGEAVANVARLDETFLAGIMARHPSGLAVLPAPGMGDDEPPLTTAAVERMLELLRNMYPVVVVDAGAGMNEPALKAMELADQVFLAMVLSLPCLANVKRIVESFGAMNPAVEKRISLVINRHLSRSEISLAEVRKIVGKTVSWLIPNDYEATLTAMNQGKTLLEVAPKSPVVKAIGAMAATLVAPADKAEGARGSLLGRLLAWPRAASL